MGLIDAIFKGALDKLNSRKQHRGTWIWPS